MRFLGYLQRLAWWLLLACLGPPVAAADEAWQAPHLRDHPLVDRIWASAEGRYVEPAELRAQIDGHRLILLGEVHVNPDHHRLQRRVIQWLLAEGRRPALAFEMFDRQDQAALDRLTLAGASDVDRLAEATDFSARGWEWPLYRPLVTLGVEHDLPLIAANLSRKQATRVAREGLQVLGEERLQALGLYEPLPQRLRERLESEILEGHCGQISRQMAAAMADAQRARDATMADSLLEAPSDGAVLIAGAGHVRRDYAVPYYLGRRSPEADTVSLAFVPVTEGDEQAQAYQPVLGNAVFDYLWFTPRQQSASPCEAFQEELQRLDNSAGNA